MKKEIQEFNYHTHTARCKHAVGTVEEYCREAISAGLKRLGFSDHCPFPDKMWSHVRMRFSELEAYCREIDQAREILPELTIFKGLECEFCRDLVPYYQEEFLGKNNIEYLVAAAHWFPCNGEWLSIASEITDATALNAYVQCLISAMESRLFSFVAHPDAFANSYRIWDEEAITASKDLLAAAAELNVPLEINGLGLRKPKISVPEGKRSPYPILPFWELASEYDIRVVINSDAHHPEDIIANIEEATAIADKFHLRIVEPAVTQPD